MKVGLFQTVQWPEGSQQQQRYRELIEQCEVAEKLGYDSVWLTEHHFTRHGITSDSLALVHSSGLAMTMTEADGIVLRGDEMTRFVVKPGKIEATAGSISLSGIVALGANTAAAIPLMPGVATQPTPSVFFSPV